MTVQRRPFTITKVRHDQAGGFARARITADGVTVEVDRRHGSWQTTPPDGAKPSRRDVLPHIAAALQRATKALDRDKAARPAA